MLLRTVAKPQPNTLDCIKYLNYYQNWVASSYLFTRKVDKHKLRNGSKYSDLGHYFDHVQRVLVVVQNKQASTQFARVL